MREPSGATSGCASMADFASMVGFESTVGFQSTASFASTAAVVATAEGAAAWASDATRLADKEWLIEGVASEGRAERVRVGAGVVDGVRCAETAEIIYEAYMTATSKSGGDH